MKWYYDIETRTCKEFHYGGCLGNKNNFPNMYECSNFCWEYLSDEARDLSLNPPTTTQTSTSTTSTTHVSTKTQNYLESSREGKKY
jgi:hypothetical protein